MNSIHNQQFSGNSVQPSNQAPLVTIAIPTYNRTHLLQTSLASALSQDYTNIHVVVLDNASTDNTKEIVELFADKRVFYLRNEFNIGMVNNWNRATEVCTSPYFILLQDDDLLLPDFVSQSLAKLEKHPQAAFSFALIRHIDKYGMPGKVKEMHNQLAELTSGLDYLHLAVSGKGWFIHSSSVVMRTEALKEIAGKYDSPHARHAFDFNLFVRLASRFDVLHVPKELVQVRSHPEQDTDTHWRATTGTGPLGFTAERLDALAYLLGSVRAQDPAYRKWLMERLLTLNAQQSAYAHVLLPDMYWTWQERLEIAKREITHIVPQGETFILADEEQWATGGEVAGRQALAFNNKNGIYWGPPADDQEAIKQIEQYQQAGIRFFIIGWPAFWVMEHYTIFEQYLHSTAKLVFRSPRLIAYALNVSTMP